MKDIKIKILKYFGLDKIMEIVLNDHEYTLKLRRDVTKLNTYRSRVHASEERIKEMKRTIDDMLNNKLWAEINHKRYISDVKDLLDNHKKWLEINGLVKAPTKA